MNCNNEKPPQPPSSDYALKPECEEHWCEEVSKLRDDLISKLRVSRRAANAAIANCDGDLQCENGVKAAWFGAQNDFLEKYDKAVNKLRTSIEEDEDCWAEIF